MERGPAGEPSRVSDGGEQGTEARPLVLVVEDQPELARLLCDDLAAHFRVEAAAGGEAGVAAVVALRPDLVLCDEATPGPDGEALLRSLRALPELAATPVVILTGKLDEQLRLQLLRDGASDYVLRPFAVEEVRARVAALLRARAAGDQNQQLVALLRERSAHLTALAGELEQTSRELESFTYSVSHDLRAPLRAIDGFSHALVDEYAQALDETGLGYLRRVRRGAQRMGRMIEDLIQLSRVSRAELSIEDVDLSALAREVAGELGLADAARPPVAFRAGPTPPARGDRHLLRIVLENLLGNAWKFTSKNAAAAVELSCVESAEGIAYCVRDNGAGFEMRHYSRLFTPFQRLHTEEEFPGSGIGLATAQRIVRRHGGRIWASAEPDRGAVFYFTLAPL
ncbi:MAG TPA: ATP-binding protein [Kofleriaceae bacterium]|nr:ATP-binding protein [Kofleriaceae bacterium]